MSAVRLVPDEPRDRRALDSIGDSEQQVREAKRALDLPLDAYLRLPYASLDRLLGGWAPGEVHFGCAFSGGGKTLLVSNLERDLIRVGVPVYHIGLETKPALVRLHMACLEAGVFYGDVVSGALKGTEGWDALADDLKYRVQRQRIDDLFTVNSTEWLDVRGLTLALEEAHEIGAQLVVIDHVDHLHTPDSMSLYQASVATIKRLHSDTQRLGLRVFALSQLNNDAVRADRLAVHRPPRPEQVYMGGHKRMVATSMLGIYRPLRTDATPDEFKAVQDGRADPSAVTAPDVMALVCMKNRNYGNREGKRVMLRVDKGRLSEMPERDLHVTSYGYQP